MRKALVVGIDYYEHLSGLSGCVNDAHAVKSVLDRDSDGSVNFTVKLLTGTGPADLISRAELKEQIKALFEGECEIALLYFAGHGYIESTGGYLVSSDSHTGDDGLSIQDILTFSNSSPSQNKIIILDSCHSGVAGSSTISSSFSQLKEGTTILTASTADQYADEENDAGVFTTLFIDALNGAAGNLLGDVTPGSAYAHIDQSLGPWEQRPVFKTNVQNFVSLRKVQPPISLQELQQIVDFFPSPGYEFQLDPSFEPERQNEDPEIPEPDPINIIKFGVLQKYNRVNLLIPVDAPHMWHAAMESKACKLTVLGEHYRKLIEKGRI